MLLSYRETVDFDPSKKSHRMAVAAFLKRRAWNDSPIRFRHDPNYGSLSDQVQDKLLGWYLSQEASKTNKKEVAKGPSITVLTIA